MSNPYTHVLSHMPLSCTRAGDGGQQDDYAGALTALFRDIAVAVEEHEPFLRQNFAAESVLDVVMGLQVRY